MTTFPENTAFLAVTPSMRKRLATTIENLIALLDEIEGDENLESTGDEEPWLGWPVRGPSSFHESGSGDDREADDSDDEDGGDSEPTLGAPERHPSLFAGSGPAGSQLHWADGRRGDHEREDENEHGGDILDEPHDDDEREPFMGWPERFGQGSCVGIDCSPDMIEPDGDDDSDSLGFTGEGHRQAHDMLRGRIRERAVVVRLARS